jgi:hypothetical protein
MNKPKKPEAYYLKSGYYATPALYAKIIGISRQALTRRIQRGQMFSHRIGEHYILWMGSMYRPKK